MIAANKEHALDALFGKRRVAIGGSAFARFAWFTKL